ncbi:MAG: Rieske 2Fe-2S domain-containing protein [Caldilineaceae bacterium]
MSNIELAIESMSVTTPEHQTQVMQRREFLTYAWGAALALLTIQGVGATYFYATPRFHSGEFGGKFAAGAPSALPTAGADPVGNPTGKFWLVNSDAGPKALYMVCTHLGCLYKWEPEKQRFRCPCHGSTFSRDGDYICGPAPRSLDQFVIEAVRQGQVVDVTNEANNGIRPPQSLTADTQLFVNTGKRILGRARDLSPAADQTQCV